MRLACDSSLVTFGVIHYWLNGKRLFCTFILHERCSDEFTGPAEFHAGDILLATVRDMESVQTSAQRSAKSPGHSSGSPENIRLNGASEGHAIGRLSSGFNLMQLVSEYRALRASVLSLWRATLPEADVNDVDDLNLFHESIDQSLAKAVNCYTKRIEESRDMFLAILSHDLRNPLNSIGMSAELIPHVSKQDPETTEFASKIASGVAVMTRMISDLLDYTRTRLGAGMPVTRAPLDLGTLCREVVAEFQSSNPDVTITLTSTGDLAGEWDSTRLRQVVSNLLGNAIQHGSRSAPNELTLKGEDADVVFSIRNQGTPIPHKAENNCAGFSIRNYGSRRRVLKRRR